MNAWTSFAASLRQLLIRHCANARKQSATNALKNVSWSRWLDSSKCYWRTRWGHPEPGGQFSLCGVWLFSGSSGFSHYWKTRLTPPAWDIWVPHFLIKQKNNNRQQPLWTVWLSVQSLSAIFSLSWAKLSRREGKLLCKRTALPILSWLSCFIII